VRDGPPAGYRPGTGVMLLDDNGRVFVARRIGTNDAWQMPQGGIDRGEKPLEAARRELKEEIGTDKALLLAESPHWHVYDFPPKLQKSLWGGRFKGQAQKWFAMRFTGSEDDVDLDAHLPEFDAWKWVEARDLPVLAVDFKRSLYRDLLAEFALFLPDNRAAG
jgi:putative (di)nucleoside polyphosphate hydrolase